MEVNSMPTKVHRRKSSRDDDIADVSVNGAPPSPTQANGRPSSPPSTPPRTRVNSTPVSPPNGIQAFPTPPPSAGASRTSFTPNGFNGQLASPFRSSFSAHGSASSSHSRTRSVSGPFAPPSPSPLGASFPSLPNVSGQPTSPDPPHPGSGSGSGSGGRRHARLHSRNLSVFFPRPGALPHTAIAEDGTQELELRRPPDLEAPEAPFPSASPSVPEHKAQLSGFSFGGRPPSSSSVTFPGAEKLGPAPTPTAGATRRGHHHKHSMSHNFFSFLEPGSETPSVDLHTQPTPTPVSPWTPGTADVNTPDPQAKAFRPNGIAHRKALSSSVAAGEVSPASVASACGVFLLGAALWVSGQQVGSLACTGLGYWVVFDAVGVVLARILPPYLARRNLQDKARRAYGNARIETVAAFGQAVYLMFAAVYVCKETVEHFLLSAGEGHHHHHGDEDDSATGIQFPVRLLLGTLLALLGTAFHIGNHTRLVNITGNRIPTPTAMLRRLRSRNTYLEPNALPTALLASVLSNPYCIAPISFCIAILLGATLLDHASIRTFDLILAMAETIVTFRVAYQACTVLGTVLLQTSPPRGMVGGRMESFLRAMKEIERHPKVLHLPAPHIWQLTPTLPDSALAGKDGGTVDVDTLAQSLIVTLELHVRADMGDADVLALTRWAWERCAAALHCADGAEAEVTVGVVRG